ncbi:MAG: hypothetical protein K2O27_07215, partial [Candidatus Amulumruptor sp.]|nr:hypothetical protein [Candidatus Amulumruptor sp.]
MKKYINGFAALAAVALISLPACSGSSKASEEQADTTAVEAAAQTEVPQAASAVVELPAGTANLDAYKGKLTVVDLNAIWCGPCRKYGPTFHAVAEKMADK